MDNGFYVSVSGMMTGSKQLADISNNIANVNTTGYRKDISVTEKFSNRLMNKLNDNVVIGGMDNQVYINDTHTIFSKGSLQQTGIGTDYALNGDGFFKVEKDNQYMYTRDGAFRADKDGFLVTHDGAYVMNKNNQRIQVKAGEEYSKDILVVDFDDKKTLAKTTNGYYENRFNLSQENVVTGDNLVMNGYLEASNVDVAEELTDLIKCQRGYQFNQRSLKIYDELMEQMSQF